MRTLLLTLLLVGFGMRLQAQIRQIEYGWDTDKGHGLNTTASVSNAGTDADVNLTIPMQGLANGYHLLYVRSRDTRGRWSHTHLRLVNVLAGAVPAKVVKVDYFYSLSGTQAGQYTYKLLSPAASVQLTVPGDISQLVAGKTYTVSIWATDENGTRSQVYSQAFTYRTVDCKNLAISISGADKFCPGNSIALSTSITGGNTPVAVSWSRNGTQVSKTSSLTVAQSGTYTAQATDAQGCVVTASMTVSESTNLPSVSIIGGISFCAGQSTTLTAASTGGTGPYAYQWKQGTTNVGSPAATLVVSTGGTYAVTVTDASGCASTSATATVPQRPSPTATVTASAPGFTTGSSVSLSANTGTGLTYQWTRDGQPIAGATQATYLTQQPGSFAVVVAQDGCSTTSQAITINLITALEEPQTGSDFQVSVSPNPSSGLAEVRLNSQPGKTVWVTLIVRDLMGRSLYQKQIKLTGPHTEPLDLSQQSAGLYLLNAATDNQQTNLRLIRQ